jgi:hypothetical protein
VRAARLAPLLALLALAACHRNDPSGPGGVSRAENKALDDAAEMIEKQRLPQEALRPPTQAPAAAAN